jgi:hypothetical protein
MFTFISFHLSYLLTSNGTICNISFVMTQRELQGGKRSATAGPLIILERGGGQDMNDDIQPVNWNHRHSLGTEMGLSIVKYRKEIR